MTYTLRQAAKATGKAPNTIRNAIKKGRISASQDDTGQFSIEPVELHRIYPLLTEQGIDGGKLHDVEPPKNQGMNTAEREAYEAQIALLREMVEKSDANADEWRKQAQNLALTHERPRSGGLFSWLRKAG